MFNVLNEYSQTNQPSVFNCFIHDLKLQQM